MQYVWGMAIWSEANCDHNTDQIFRQGQYQKLRSYRELPTRTLFSHLKVALSPKILEKFYVSNINIPNHYFEQKIWINRQIDLADAMKYFKFWMNYIIHVV